MQFHPSAVLGDTEKDAISLTFAIGLRFSNSLQHHASQWDEASTVPQSQKPYLTGFLFSPLFPPVSVQSSSDRSAADVDRAFHTYIKYVSSSNYRSSTPLRKYLVTFFCCSLLPSLWVKFASTPKGILYCSYTPLIGRF